jgi:hypothetical protein
VQAPCFGNPELYIQCKFLDRSESTTKQASNIELLPPGGPVIIEMKGFRGIDLGTMISEACSHRAVIYVSEKEMPCPMKI